MLAEYIAASIPLHVADGWTYLARAFQSIRAGDRNTAFHLAYYAELRAAMSLLASEGVGVFRRRHVAIGPECAPTIWRKDGYGTHDATWKLIGSWAEDNKRATTLLKCIRVEERTIDGWFDAADIRLMPRLSVAREWLTAWSIDLEYFEKDHKLRDHVSYRPGGIAQNTSREVVSSEEIIDPFFNIWSALEPSPDLGGAAIDRILLQRALTKAHSLFFSKSETWEVFLSRLEGVATPGFQQQLKDSSKREHYVFTWADNRSKTPSIQSVLARASLLLRIANGVCARRLDDAGVKKKELQFWWTSFGRDGGLWPEDADLDSFADLLWPEVVLALDDCERELDQMNSSCTVYDVGKILGPKVALTQFNRVPLWLLGVN
ncbi:MAG: hypothetical protein OXN19_14795 [Caldilineaceae bacterium]|nr:hypothetical protein [Caldilineaceae bacterium]